MRLRQAPPTLAKCNDSSSEEERSNHHVQQYNADLQTIRASSSGKHIAELSLEAATGVNSSCAAGMRSQEVTIIGVGSSYSIQLEGSLQRRQGPLAAVRQQWAGEM